MSNFWLLLAAVCAFGVCLTHLFLGGKVAARPLLAKGVSGSVAKFTLWYAWHIVTLTIAGIACMLLFASFRPQETGLAWAGILLAGSFVLLNLFMLVRFQLKPMHYPQWLLFLPVVIFGLLGVLS